MKLTTSLGLCALSLTTLLTGCTQIDTGDVGVEKVWGRIQDEPLGDGLHWYNPLTTKIEQVSTKLTAVTDKVRSASRDLQTVDTQVTVTFSVTPSMAPKMIANIGNTAEVGQNILAPGVQESVKAITAGYSAEDLIKERAAVKAQIEKAIENYVNSVLSSKGVADTIQIKSVAITDFNFSQEFDVAIEAKVKAEQDALKAVNEKTKRITEAEAANAEAHLQAEAEAYTMTTKATAEANATTANSIARAGAIEREGQAITKNPSIIELRKIERWDGVLPRYTLGGGTSLIQLPQDSKN